MKTEVYWREDKQDDYIHVCFECPEISAAKKIGKGTIGAANASGHVRACPKCNEAKRAIYQEQENLRQIREQEKKAEIEKAREQENKKIAPCAVAAAFFTLLVCFFVGSYFYDGVAETNFSQGYSEGQDNKEDAVNDAYNSGYNEGYDDGYSSAMDDLSYSTDETYSQDYSQVVYITRTGSKYHNFGCQYLSESCIKVSIEYALENGFEPCSKCW